MASTALPVLPFTADLAGVAPHRDLCTDCGVSRSSQPHRCGQVCQFINPQYEKLEAQVHGRARDPQVGDELFFGPYLSMHRARMLRPLTGAQWTGITTRISERLLETGMVDAVIATAADPQDKWKPRPVIITRAEDMQQARGMKMGYSPVLALLEEAIARGHRRIALHGVACQVHALRALEQELGLDALYVIGTPCSDNTTTEKFHDFLGLLADRPADVTYLEFMPDYHVELRFVDGSVKRVPFIQLPIAKLPKDFIPLTCRSCFDYTNALADITVGYMGGEGDQWLLVRNARGAAMLEMLRGEVELSAPGSKGDREKPLKTFVSVLSKQAGGMPVRRPPQWIKPIIGWAQATFGPKGLEFARTRVDMKAAEGIINLRAERPRRVRRLVPSFAWTLVKRYGLVPTARELPALEATAVAGEDA